MRRFVGFAVSLLLVFALVLPSRAAKVIKMNLNEIYGPRSFQTLGVEHFAKLVKKYSHGTVVIAVHPGGSLGFKGTMLLQAVREAQVPMSDILMGVVAGSEHVFGISSLPMLVSSFKEARGLYEQCKPFYEKAALKWNQKFLYASPWPPSGLVTKVPVRDVKDLKGLKIRTYDKNGAKFLRLLGANAISMPWGSVYSALRTGLINGVLTSAESAKNGRFWEVLNYFTGIHYAYPLNMVTINLDYWKALSKSQKEAMLRAAKETEEYQWKRSEQITVTAKEVLAKHGMKILEPTPKFMKALKKAAYKMDYGFMEQSSPAIKKILSRYIHK